MTVTASGLSGAGTVDRTDPPGRPAGEVPTGEGLAGEGSAGGAPVAEAPDQAAAVRAAREQGSRVEATDLRTGTRTVFAEPDGTMTAELSTRPVRAQRDGSWVDVDTTLVRRRDGTVGPVAATVELSFSGGGADAPLVRYGRDGGWIELSWPGELPVPTLAGDTATYPQVLPGVDLVLRAEADGYAQHLVVADAAAAANPAVHEVRLGLRTGLVELRADEDGALAARDADGTVVFAAPVSQMWDASTPPRRAVVGVEVEDAALVLRPDRELLADPATRFPVTVDPVFHTPDKQSWTSVLSGFPGTAFWNSSGSPPWAQVGRCYVPSGECNGLGVAWTYWLFDTRFLAGKSVLAANLQATVVHSPDCSDRTHQVWKASGAIHSGTMWSNRPGGTHLGNFAAEPVRSNCPGNKTAAPSVTSAVNRGGSTTFFVKAANESDELAWRRYDNNAKLKVHYNTAPNRPTGLTTDPPVPAPCKWCAGVPYLGDGGVRLQARLSDPDNDQVRPLWHINLGGTVSQPRGTFKPSGNLHDQFVDLRSRHNQAVDWAVKAEDGAHGSAYAHGVRFVVDRQPPTVAPGVTGELYQQDNRWHGGVGVPGTFRFDSAGVGDINHYLYGWNDPPATKVDADALGGTASVNLTPPGDGPRDLFVQSVDRAGHRSPMQVYHFYVRAGSGPLAQWSFEGNPDDEAFLGDRDGTLGGPASYGPGAVGSAVQFEYGGHMAAVKALRTDTSFAVSAWVRLDEVVGSHTAVSQSGQLTAGFRLGYRSDHGNGWTFGLTRGDGVGATTDVAASGQPGVPRTWTHLTGVYDAPAGQIRLYVDGVLAGTAAHTNRWNATGLVRIGNTQSGEGTQNNHWLGAVDEVELYDRVLSDAEVRAAVGADNVQVGHWKFDELTGTTGRNAAAGGDMLALHDGASFTGDSDGDGLADGGAVGGAVQLDGQDDTATTAGPVVHTDRSFAVAGWVKLDQPPPVSGTVTALSQDGAHISGFFLGYRQLAGGGFWELYTPTADSPDRPAGDAVVRSDQPAQLGTWTHLAAVYDAPAGQLRLYVNGELSGTAARTTGFDATGALVIGRGYHGGPSGYWPGRVDEVRAYSRELSEAEVRAVVSRDDVALGQWRLDGNTDDATGSGHHGAVAGAPEWTGGQTEVPDPTDLAIRLHGGDHVSLPATLDVRQSFSVAAWVKLDQVGGTATVVSQDGSQTSAFSLMATPAGRWALAVAGSDVVGGGAARRLDGPTAQVGVWTHLVGVYDAGAGQLSLYVNGVRSGTLAHTQTWSHAAGELQIGTGFSGGNRTNRLIGAVDDVTVYSRVLFAEQVQEMAGRDLSLAHNWRLDEGSGDQAADAVGRRTATLAGGAQRVPGRLGNAVALDGADDRVATGGVDVRTDASFTVTTWVNLAETCEVGSQFSCARTAVSLDGGADHTSKFRLGHTVDRGQNPEGVWFFELPEPDGTVTKAAVTVETSDFNNWVHLAGVYDEATGKLWLYVNGTRKGDGTLVEPWHGTGGLQIGRGRDLAGEAAQFFPGMVDDVRLYSGRLDDGRISNLYSSYPEEEDGAAELPTADAGHWSFDENTGTTVADSSGRGLAATMSGGADWTAGRIGHAGRFDGVDGYAQTTGPVLDTAGSFSVSAWAYLTRETETQIVLAQDGDQASGFFLYYDVASHRWAAGIPAADSATTTLVGATATERVFAGHWTHLGLVYHAELAQLRLYVNGRLAAAQVGVDSWSADGPLTIGRGRGQGADGGYFKGAVDDVRAFGTALTDGELGRVYDDTGPVGVGHWRFDDQTLRDSSWRDNPTTASGPVSYLDGVDGMALSLDGTAAATTERWGVSEAGSLTVSAWVMLTHEPAVQTVLSQDGSRRSSFALQYQPSLDRWTFGAYSQDADEAELVYARSEAAAELNRWTHLTGVYDHAAGQLRLYVDGQLAGGQDGVTLWPSTGGLTIGRGKQDGAPGQFFTGAIDEVRIDLGIVPPDQIAQRAQRP